MAWVSASLPLAAVTSGGRLRVISGSIRAALANQPSWRRLNLAWVSASSRTAFLVTSAPVPAVVGTAIQGSPPPLSVRSPRWYSYTVPGRGCSPAMALAASIALPPPMPIST